MRCWELLLRVPRVMCMTPYLIKNGGYSLLNKLRNNEKIFKIIAFGIQKRDRLYRFQKYINVWGHELWKLCELQLDLWLWEIIFSIAVVLRNFQCFILFLILIHLNRNLFRAYATSRVKVAKPFKNTINIRRCNFLYE